MKGGGLAVDGLAAIPWPDRAQRAETAPAPRSALRRPLRLAFWVAVLVFLTFSQGWVMFLTGPNGDPSNSSAVRALFFPGYALAIGLAVTDLKASVRAAVAAPLLWLLMALV